MSRTETMRPQRRSGVEESISIWLAAIFIIANVAYFLLIPALGLKGQPSQGWMWAIVPVIDMLYIAIQAFCLILSGARSHQFGFTDIAVSWASVRDHGGSGVLGGLLARCDPVAVSDDGLGLQPDGSCRGERPYPVWPHGLFKANNRIWRLTGNPVPGRHDTE